MIAQNTSRQLPIKKVNIRSLTFSRAWAIFKQSNGNKPFAICLSKAWAAYRLYKAMEKEPQNFEFVTLAGPIRKAHGTAKSDHRQIMSGFPIKTKSLTSMPYWDLERNAWRSFNIGNLITA